MLLPFPKPPVFASNFSSVSLISETKGTWSGVALQCGHDLSAKKAIVPREFEGFAEKAICRFFRSAQSHQRNWMVGVAAKPNGTPNLRQKRCNNPCSIAKEQVFGMSILVEFESRECRNAEWLTQFSEGFRAEQRCIPPAGPITP
jgi:hypothetical protein